jgi:hypothetical protein
VVTAVLTASLAPPQALTTTNTLDSMRPPANADFLRWVRFFINQGPVV